MIFQFKNSTVEIIQTVGLMPKNANSAKAYLKDLKIYLKERKNYNPGSGSRREMVEQARYYIRRYREAIAPLIRIDVSVTSKKYPKQVSKFDFSYPQSTFKEHKLKQVAKDCNQSALSTFRRPYTLNRKLRPSIAIKNTKFGDLRCSHLGAGRTFSEPGQIIKLHIRKNCSKVFDPKTPATPNRYLGVEIEFCTKVTQDQIVLDLYNTGMYKYVQLKEDRSLRPKPGEFGYEFAILLRETSYKKDLRKIGHYLEKIGATATDRRCGLHVHFDMRKRRKEVVYNNLVLCQEALWKVVDPHRYDNEFCRIVHSREFPLQFNNTREERYKTINAASYFRHHTIEIRMHEGTVDFKTITNWVDLLLRIVNFKRKIKGNVLSLFSLKKRIRIPGTLFGKVLDRSRYWQINGTRDREPELATLTVTDEQLAAPGGEIFIANPTAPPEAWLWEQTPEPPQARPETQVGAGQDRPPITGRTIIRNGL